MGKRRKPSGQLACPHCGSEKYRTLLSGGVTRCCNRKVVRVNGAVFRNLDEAPEWRVIQEFVAQKRKRGLARYEVPYGSATYREFLTSAQILLERCGGDLELALGVIDVSFNDPRHSWRDHLNMFSIVSAKYYPDAHSRAVERVEEQRAREELQKSLAGTHVDEMWMAAYEAVRRSAEVQPAR